MSSQPVGSSSGERIWRATFFIVSAAIAASALVNFDDGSFGKGLGDLGAAILLLSLMVQFPFLRAIVKVSRERDAASPETLRKQRDELMEQAERVRTASPWAEMAGRAGWVLLGVSLLLRISGVS